MRPNTRYALCAELICAAARATGWPPAASTTSARRAIMCARCAPIPTTIIAMGSITSPRPAESGAISAATAGCIRPRPVAWRATIPAMANSTLPASLKPIKGAAKEQQKFFRSPRLPKNQREGQSPFALQSSPAACTAGTGRFLRRKISFSRAKIASLQFPRPEIRRILAETGEGRTKAAACGGNRP